jgi:multidrug efflux system outer membrane protein
MARVLHLGVLLACLSLPACTMIPKYKRPDAPVAAQFPGGSAQAGLASEIRWRDFFLDARLKRLVGLALQNNRNLRVAALTVALYQARYRIQRAELVPTIGATASFARSRTTIPPSTQPVTYNEFGATVGTTSYELDFFGRVRSLNRQALETYLASDESRRSTEISLVAQVATQYLTLLADQEQLNLAEQTRSSLQRSFALNQLGFDAGTVSQLTLATAESQAHTAEVSVFEYERLTAQAVNYLTLLVGETLPADLPLGGSLSEQGTFTDLPAGLPSDLIARRPDILSAEHALLAANANIGSARAAFFPTVSLTASGGFASTQFSSLFASNSTIWNFAPSIGVPIFNGGANIAALDEANVSKRIQIATYEETIQTAFREVADAIFARDRYVYELGAQHNLVLAEQRVYDLSKLSYSEGVDSYLTVLVAQQNLYTSQSNLITTKVNRLANLVALYKALGGGWR